MPVKKLFVVFLLISALYLLVSVLALACRQQLQAWGGNTLARAELLIRFLNFATLFSLILSLRAYQERAAVIAAVYLFIFFQLLVLLVQGGRLVLPAAAMHAGYLVIIYFTTAAFWISHRLIRRYLVLFGFSLVLMQLLFILPVYEVQVLASLKFMRLIPFIFLFLMYLQLVLAGFKNED